MPGTDQLISIDAEDPKYYADLLSKIPTDLQNSADRLMDDLARRPRYSERRCRSFPAPTVTSRFSRRYLTLSTRQWLCHDGQLEG